VALLADTKEWRAVAKDMAREGGLHYIPVEEALVYKVWVRRGVGTHKVWVLRGVGKESGFG